MAGVALGVWALITVMSVMNGFHADLRERILFVVSHVTISGQGGQLRDWRGVSRRAAEHSQVRAQAPFILGQGMLTRGGATAGVLIRGISPEREREVSQVLEHITEGESELVPGEFEIILGATLARSLGVFVGDKVTLVAPKGRVTPAGFLPRLKRFRVKGLFQIDMHQYDSGIALVHIEDAAKLFLPGGGGESSPGRVSGLRLKTRRCGQRAAGAPRPRRRARRRLRGARLEHGTRQLFSRAGN